MSDDLETRTSPEKSGAGDPVPLGQIGAYTLIRPLGEGGMGTVYLAEQHAPVERRVALKVIKPGMDTRDVIARFEAERQALAVMDHPGIARVFDGGATDTGRPFFAMEFVQGEPITRFADRTGLSIRDRVSLFIDVCRAVQHAHQKGIIHRDLKPSNVLVTLQDGRPAAKVIDFGVAKAVEQPLTHQTFATGIGQFVGTPAYIDSTAISRTLYGDDAGERQLGLDRSHVRRDRARRRTTGRKSCARTWVSDLSELSSNRLSSVWAPSHKYLWHSFRAELGPDRARFTRSFGGQAGTSGARSARASANRSLRSVRNYYYCTHPVTRDPRWPALRQRIGLVPAPIIVLPGT